MEQLAANASTFMLLFFVCIFLDYARSLNSNSKATWGQDHDYTSSGKTFFSAKNAAWERDNLPCHLLLWRRRVFLVHSFTAHKGLWDTQFYMEVLVSNLILCVGAKTQTLATNIQTSNIVRGSTVLTHGYHSSSQFPLYAWPLEISSCLENSTMPWQLCLFYSPECKLHKIRNLCLFGLLLFAVPRQFLPM